MKKHPLFLLIMILASSALPVPSRNAGVAVLANMDGVDSTALADELLGILLSASAAP